MSNGAKKFLVFFIAATLIVLLRQLFSDYLALKYFSGIIIGLAAIFIVSNLGKTKNRNEADATEPAGAIKRYLNADNGVHIEARAISIRIAIALSIVIFVSGAFVINIYAPVDWGENKEFWEFVQKKISMGMRKMNRLCQFSDLLF